MEHFHLTLKNALRVAGNPLWAKSLSLVFLSIRSAYKEDLRVSLAEMVYGTGISGPGKFLCGTRGPVPKTGLS